MVMWGLVLVARLCGGVCTCLYLVPVKQSGWGLVFVANVCTKIDTSTRI
uniref:Uncharacterized protein n=1 Tax=Anguilla anguilla TaxID=7936 RepID=A0A0E9Q476_ANGAN